MARAVHCHEPIMCHPSLFRLAAAAGSRWLANPLLLPSFLYSSLFSPHCALSISTFHQPARHEVFHQDNRACVGLSGSGHHGREKPPALSGPWLGDFETIFLFRHFYLPRALQMLSYWRASAHVTSLTTRRLGPNLLFGGFPADCDRPWFELLV